MNNELREMLIEHINDNEISKTEISDKTGIKRPTIIRYLNSPAELSESMIEKVELAIMDYFKSENAGTEDESADDEAPTTKQSKDILATGDTNGIFAVCRSCQTYMGFGIVSGRPGSGKTYSLKHYAKMPRVAYIECNDIMNSKDIIKLIERELCLPYVNGSINDNVEAIAEFFNRNEGYLLIIDEADKMMNRYTQKKIEMLRSLHDRSDVGMVLAGEPALEKMIVTYVARMSDRTDLAYRMGGLTRDEILEYVSDFKLTEDAENELVKRATNSKNGSFRLLARTVKNLKRMFPGKVDIDIDMIKQVSNMMLL